MLSLRLSGMQPEPAATAMSGREKHRGPDVYRRRRKALKRRLGRTPAHVCMCRGRWLRDGWAEVESDPAPLAAWTIVMRWLRAFFTRA